jgi:hypothetical protein
MCDTGPLVFIALAVHLYGGLRPVISALRCLAAFYEKNGHPWLLECQMPLFSSQRGFMTATSIGRHLTEIYRRAGIASTISRSGRRTMMAIFNKS